MAIHSLALQNGNTSVLIVDVFNQIRSLHNQFAWHTESSFQRLVVHLTHLPQFTFKMGTKTHDPNQDNNTLIKTRSKTSSFLCLDKNN